MKARVLQRAAPDAFEFDPDQPRDETGKWTGDSAGASGDRPDARPGGAPGDTATQAVAAVAQAQDPQATAYRRTGDPEGQFGIQDAGVTGVDKDSLPLTESIKYGLAVLPLSDDADQENRDVHTLLRQQFGMNPDLSKNGLDVGTVAFGRDADGNAAWRAFDIENKEITPRGTLFFPTSEEAVKAVLSQ